MYDFHELESAHNGLWLELRALLAAAGISRTPERLERGLHHAAAWAHPHLLLGQACEYPLTKSVGSAVRLVATPRYDVPGCTGASYRSAIIVRRDDSATGFADLKGRRCVVNEPNSNSGMNLLRAAIAPHADQGRFFDSVQVSGAHRRSIESVITGDADVAAIDCVSLAHLSRVDPVAGESVRILGWTPASPSLPYITSASTTDETLRQLRSALRALTEGPAAQWIRDQLFLVGFDFEPDPGFSQVRRLEQDALNLGYLRLQ